MRYSRPTSVSVISWLLIISAVVEGILLDWMRQRGDVRSILGQGSIPLDTQLVWIFAGMALTGICGVLILNGLNWARFLYVLQGAAGHTAFLATTPFRWIFVPGLLLFAVSLYVLFHPRSNAYFRGEHFPEDLRGRYWQGH